MATAAGSYKAHRIDTATTWGTWAEAAGLQAITAREGAGQILGEATLRTWYGTGRLPGATGAGGAISAPTDYLGRYVRIGIDDGASGWDWIWYGTIDRIVTTDDGSSGQVDYLCTGLAGLLQQTCIDTGYEIDYNSSTVIDPGFCPRFNSRPGGDRYASTVSVNGSSVYIHDRTVTGNKWTAKQVLDFLLAAFSSAPAFALSDPDSCLGYVIPESDFHGATLFDAINQLVNPRRGCTWRLTTTGSGTATITVRSIAASAITVGSYTLPASTATATVTPSTLWADDVVIERDASAAYDEIIVEGARPWSAITLRYDNSSGSLVADWTSTQEAQWNSEPNHTTEPVWRSFKIADTWLGEQNGETTIGLTEARTIDVSTQKTGARSYDSGDVPVPTVYELTRDLPIADGWVNSTDGSRQAPIALIYDGSNYLDACNSQDSDGLGLSLHIDTQPGGRITIGGVANQDDLADLLAAGELLLVTVGIREQRPLAVSWINTGSTPRGHQRRLMVRMPWCELWQVIDETVTGVDPSTPSTLTKQSTALTIRDDTATLQQALALLRAYYSGPGIIVRWRDRGQIEYGSTYTPGTLLTTCTTSAGAQTVNAVITSRAWTFAGAGYGTSYATERLIPDLDAIR